MTGTTTDRSFWLRARLGLAVPMLAILLWGTRAVSAEWQQGEGYRYAPLEVPEGKPGFTLMDHQAIGIQFTNFISDDRLIKRQNLMNGSGVAAGDFDGDGWCDLYFCHKEGRNGLYRNLGGWRFADVTEEMGVRAEEQSSTGAVFADLNGNGRLDLLVTSFGGPNALFLNEGNDFREVAKEAGFVSDAHTTSMALADLDGDGDLDLYVNSFGLEAILRDGALFSTRVINGKVVVRGRYAKRLEIVNNQILELGEPDLLFWNDGQGRFRKADWKAHFTDAKGRPLDDLWDFGLAVQIRDIDGDGDPDIYVCNDFQTPDRVWLNDGKGRFRAMDPLAMRSMSYASMGVDFADIDRDGHLDFFTVEMLSRKHGHHLRQSSPMQAVSRVPGDESSQEDVPRNTLFWNRGDGTYAEIAQMAGVAASDWSWTPIFLDVDLDGYEDALVSNGHMHDVNDIDTAARAPDARDRNRQRFLLEYPKLETPNAAFRNRGDLTFESMDREWGFGSRRISHGMALADLDRDGDMDVVLNCIGDAPLIYRNDGGAPRLAVRLKGRAPNTQGVGARIRVTGGPVVQEQEILSGGRYLSGGEAMRTFAAWGEESLKVEVFWRSGGYSLLERAEANHIYEIDERNAGEPPAAPKQVDVEPLFADVSEKLSHRHVEDYWDDLRIQPTLPDRLGQSGPGMAWFDWDGDGREDLLISGARGHSLELWMNRRDGFETVAKGAGWQLPADAGAVLGYWSGEQPRLLAGLIHGHPAGAGPSLMEGDAGSLKPFAGGTSPLSGANVGPLAMADVDGDGDLDLFVGGYHQPGGYPAAASSVLFHNEEGRFQVAKEFEGVGVVRGAVFTDVNGDGKPDLVLARDWDSLSLWLSDGDQWREASKEWGLEGLRGRWTGIVSGDFNGDGRMDLVAGNWGKNSLYESHRGGHPLRLYFGDVNGDGIVEMLEAVHNPDLGDYAPLRRLDTIGRGFPAVSQRVKNHRAYGESTVGELFGDTLDRLEVREIPWLEHTLLLNEGGGFRAVALPLEAQVAPVFGLAVADADGDGREDVFLAQNFFATHPETSRYDAGRGLWLLGNGRGELMPVSGQRSGVKIYGEQRGCAVADWNGDRRVDLAVTQNGGQTRLFENRSGRAGLLVRLKGPSGNREGVGAAVRLQYVDGTSGPVREVQKGSGYWSQNSAAQILGMEKQVKSVWVRWPGGEETVTPVDKGSEVLAVAPGIGAELP